jgi:hypothetical protein
MVTRVLESMLPPSLVLHLFLEDGGNILLRNVSNHLADCTVDFPSRITSHEYVRPRVACSGPTTGLRKRERGSGLLASTDRLENENPK